MPPSSGRFSTPSRASSSPTASAPATATSTPTTWRPAPSTRPSGTPSPSAARCDRLAGLDNFCWCDPVQSEKTPDGEYKLAQLVRANKALYDYTRAYGVPCISGKDSMKNDYQIGGHEDLHPADAPLLRHRQDRGRAQGRDHGCQDARAISSTSWERRIGNWAARSGTPCTALSATRSRRWTRPRGQGALHGPPRRSCEGLVASCHDCSDGGLGVALAETAFAGGLGMRSILRPYPQGGSPGTTSCSSRNRRAASS